MVDTVDTEAQAKARRQAVKDAIAERIAVARRAANVTQDAIAHQLNLSKQTVSHWEHGRSEITVPAAIRLARILGVSVDWLLTGGGTALSETRKVVGSRVPLVGMPELLALTSGEFQLSAAKQFRYSFLSDLSDEAVSFAMPDRGLEPKIAAGDIVTVDPSEPLEPGNIAAFMIGDQLLVRFYRPAADSLRGRPPFMLRPTHPDYPDRAVSLADPAHFFGTLVEVVMLGSR